MQQLQQEKESLTLGVSEVTTYGSSTTNHHPATTTTATTWMDSNENYDILSYHDDDQDDEDDDYSQKEEFVDPTKMNTKKTYRVYFYRWIILLSFALLSFLNSWIWITWSPFTLELAKMWNVSTASVNDLSAVFMYVYIPLSFPALYFLNVYKLRVGLLVGGGWNWIGAGLRYWGMASYSRVYAGTVVCAMCQTLTLAMPPLISTLWFPDHERGLSTSLGVLANQLGAALGLGVTIFIPFQTTLLEKDEDDGVVVASAAGETALDTDQLKRYLRYQFLWSGFSFLLILVLVRSDQPPTPPSEAAHRSHPPPPPIHHQDQQCNRTLLPTVSYWQSISLLLSNTSGSALCMVYGLSLGVLYTLPTFLAQVFSYAKSSSSSQEIDNDWGENDASSLSWTETEIGYLGATLILSGIVGSLVSGEYLDRTQQQPQSHRKVSIVLLVGALLAMILFAWSRAILPLNRYLAFLTTGLVGCCLTGFMSVGFEYGTAISYPADEAAVAGVMNVAAQIGGWLLVAIGGRMMTVSTTATTRSNGNDGSSLTDRLDNNLVDEEEESVMVARFNNVMVGSLVGALVLLWTTVYAKSQRPISASS